MSNAPPFEKFDPDAEDFVSWTERFSMHIDRYNVKDPDRVKHLIADIGLKPYAVLRRLASPKLPKDNSYAENIKLLMDYYEEVKKTETTTAATAVIYSDASRLSVPSGDENKQADRSDGDGVGNSVASKKRKSPPLIAEVYKRPKCTVVNLSLPVNFHSKKDGQIRSLFYIAMANSKQLSDAYDDVVSNMKKFFGTYCLSNFSDMLISFTKETNVVKMPADFKDVTEIPIPQVVILDSCLHKPIEISEAILVNHQRNAACSTLTQIGFQYVASHEMEDKTTDMHDTDGSDKSVSSDSSNPMSKEERRELNKQLKLCQAKIQQPFKGMLGSHMNNHRRLKYDKSSAQTELKILILFPEDRKRMCQEIATHVGLVFIDYVFEECKHKVLNKKLQSYTARSNSKVYSLIQNYVCRHLVLGSNNIILTCDMDIYKNANAEVKVMLFEELEDATQMMLELVSHMSVKLEEESTFFHYLQAVSHVLNECTEFITSINVTYQVKKNNSDEVEYCRCQVPATGIIPYYILKFFCAKRMAESESEKKSLFD